MDQEFGLDEGMSRLPWRVADEALWDFRKQDCQKQKMILLHRQKVPAEPAEPLQVQERKAKHSRRGPNDHRHKHSNIWAFGGHGMQAFFLDSGGRSTGTGVFLPQTAAGTNNSQQHRRLACAPVLLPSRVVQALNLNVKELGLQISPRTTVTDACYTNKKNSKGGDLWRKSSMKSKNGEEALANCCAVMSPPRSSSPEIFLPKEWTY